MKHMPSDPPPASEAEFTGEAAQLLAALDFIEPDMEQLIPEYKTAMLWTIGFLLLLWGLLAASTIAMVWFTCSQLFSGVGQPLLRVFLLFIELTVLVFIFKPLVLRPRPGPDDTLGLVREDEPLLYAFVEKLCVRMNAPIPQSIRVCVDANAGALLENSVTGKVTLILGLPLVAGLPVRNFTAVLAHEFAHFNQKTGLRVSAWLRQSGHFLARVLYQRDQVDEWLLRQCRSGKIAPQIAGRTALIVVEASRGVLWLFLVAGEGLFCHLARQMEYDADRAAALIAGRAELLRTLEVLRFLAIGSAQAQTDTIHALLAKALPDDMVRLIVADGISLARHRDKVFEMSREERTTWRSTHPSLADRAANIGHIQTPGLVTSDIRSTHLFSNFSAVCQRATRAHYEVHFGKAATGISMVNSRRLAEDQSRRREEAFGVRRYFRTSLGTARMIFPDSSWLSPPADPAHAVSALADLRRELLGFGEAIDSLTGKDYEDLLGARTAARTHMNSLETLIATAGRMNRAAAVRELQRLRKTLVRAMGEVHEKLEELEPQVDALDRLSRQRLTLCFALSQSPALVQIAGASGRKIRQRAIEITGRCEALEKCGGLVLRMRERGVVLHTLTDTYPERLRKLFREAIQEASEAIATTIREIDQEIQTDPELVKLNAELQSSNGQTLQVAIPDSKNPVVVLAAVDRIFERFQPILLDTIAQVAMLAEDIEGAFKLSPLPETTEATPERQAEYRREKSVAATGYWRANGIRAGGGLIILLCLLWLAAGMSTSTTVPRHAPKPVSIGPAAPAPMPQPDSAPDNPVPNAAPILPAPQPAIPLPPATPMPQRPHPRSHLPPQPQPNRFPPNAYPPMYELRPVPPGQ